MAKFGCGVDAVPGGEKRRKLAGDNFVGLAFVYDFGKLQVFSQEIQATGQPCKLRMSLCRILFWGRIVPSGCVCLQTIYSLKSISELQEAKHCIFT